MWREKGRDVVCGVFGMCLVKVLVTARRSVNTMPRAHRPGEITPPIVSEHSILVITKPATRSHIVEGRYLPTCLDIEV